MPPKTFPAMPVRGTRDSTFNFEHLQKVLPVSPWKPVESLNKVEAGAQVRWEQLREVVRISGSFKTTAKIPNATRIFTIPEKYRPEAVFRLAGGNLSTGTFAFLLLETNGEAIWSGAEMEAAQFGEFEATWPLS